MARIAIAVAVAVLAATGAVPATAAVGWNDGPVEDHLARTCAAGVGPGPTEVSSQVRLATFGDPVAPPRIGDVFYARVAMAAVGGCTDKAFTPELVLPLGVETAISASNPVQCHFTLPDGSDTRLDSCPQTLLPGSFGGLSLGPDSDLDSAWAEVGRVPGAPAASRPRAETVYVEFPLRASRALAGPSGGPVCPDRAARRGPCSPQVAGDFLQVAVTVEDATSAVLTPALGLRVASGSGPPAPTPTAADPLATPAPVAAPVVTVTRSQRIRRAIRGIVVRVAVPADGTRVAARLSAVGLGRLASVTRRRAPAGSLRLRLTPSRQAARALRRVRGEATSVLQVVVTAPGQAAATETVAIRLRR